MRLYFLIAVFVMILSSTSVTHACSCAGMQSGNPACQAYWYTPVIFSGKVIEIKSDEGQFGLGSGGDRHVQFAIDEAFKGISGQTVEVSTPIQSSACGYPFKLGESYLVYIYPGKDGKLSVGLCGRTIPMSAATADIEYIKSIPTLKPLGSIGGIFYGTHNESEGLTGPPPRLSGLKVTAESPKGTVETRTDEKGKYRFADLEPGDYAVKLFAPEGFLPLKDEHKMRVIAKGCSLYDDVFSLTPSVTERPKN